MRVASVAIIAYMIMDFAPRAPVPVPEPVTAYAGQGQGELAVVMGEKQVLGSVARGATHIPFLNLNLSASCEQDITVDDLTLMHVGLGRVTDIAGVYLSDGTRRLTRAKRFDPGSREANLRFSPRLTVPKCGAVRLYVLADIGMDADIASEHGITLARVTDIRSSAKRTVLTVGDPKERVVTTPKKEGTITVNFLPVNKRLRYGRTETVARIQLTADAKASHLLKKIMLRNNADARDMDLVNMRLETRSGSVLTRTAFRMQGTSVTLEFSPSYILRRSETLVLLLKAEIHTSNYRKVDFFMEEPGDLEATVYQGR